MTIEAHLRTHAISEDEKAAQALTQAAARGNGPPDVAHGPLRHPDVALDDVDQGLVRRAGADQLDQRQL